MIVATPDDRPRHADSRARVSPEISDSVGKYIRSCSSFRNSFCEIDCRCRRMHRAHDVDFGAGVESEILRDSRNFIRREHDTKPEYRTSSLPCRAAPEIIASPEETPARAERDRLLYTAYEAVRIAFRNREHIQTPDRDLRYEYPAALDVVEENLHNTVAERDHEQ